jgi:hypothetical protein
LLIVNAARPAWQSVMFGRADNKKIFFDDRKRKKRMNEYKQIKNSTFARSDIQFDNRMIKNEENQLYSMRFVFIFQL